MTIPKAGHISNLMHGFAAGKFLRLCFVVLFGAMSVFHFPVMAFGGDPHAAHSQAAAHSHHHGGPSDHGNPAGAAHPAGTVQCDGFACFLAVEPAPLPARPPHAILFGVLRFTPSSFPLATVARPDLPPPRLQG